MKSFDIWAARQSGEGTRQDSRVTGVVTESTSYEGIYIGGDVFSRIKHGRRTAGLGLLLETTINGFVVVKPAFSHFLIAHNVLDSATGMRHCPRK